MSERSLSKWVVLPGLLLIGAVSIARAWDEQGHIIVTRIAHAKLPERMPAWLKNPEVADRLNYLCAEPDRWRGQKHVCLDHVNNPDHYFDIEYLDEYGLSLKTLPPFRREFTDILAATRAQHPDRFGSYDRKEDQDYTRQVPGLLPYRIAELQWTIASSWTTLNTYEAHRTLCTETMIENARQNIVFHMGLLSHFVGDGAQPLHTTKHHHGWIGPNPKSYTTNKHFHAEVDGDLIELHHIEASPLIPRAKGPRALSKEKYFSELCDYLNEAFVQVEPLYAMEHDGSLHKAPGKKFIEERLMEAGSMLAGVWVAAFDSAGIDEFRVKQLQKNGK